MGSILEALYAGCKLARTETMITIKEAVTTSIGAIVGARIRPVACPKLKVIFERLSPKITPNPKMTPMMAPVSPKQKPSTRNSERILRGSVPIAAIVPISLTRS